MREGEKVDERKRVDVRVDETVWCGGEKEHLVGRGSRERMSNLKRLCDAGSPPFPAPFPSASHTR